LREAAEIIAREGFAALTVRRVADAAEYSTIAIYTHFGDKRGLVEAVLLEAHAGFHAALAGADTEPPGRSQLTASAQAYRAWALRNRSAYLVMFGLVSESFVASAEASDQMIRSFVAHTQRVADAMRVGELTAGDPSEVAHHLWACVHGHVMLDLLMQRSVDDEAAQRSFDAAIGYMLDGLTRRSRPRPQAPRR